MSGSEEQASPRRAAEVGVGGWGRDLVVGWLAPWGPSLARVVRGQSGDRSATELSALVLGDAGAVQVTPKLVRAGDRLAVVWIDREGAAAAVLDEPHDHLGATPATLFAPSDARGQKTLVLGERIDLGSSVRAIAVAPGDDEAWIAVADAKGVRVGSLRANGTCTLSDAPWIAREGMAPRLALADVRGQPILCAVYPGQRELVIARREGDRPVVVTHRLDAPVADLAIEAAGSRLAIALLESDGVRVSCAFVDARGTLTERPVAQIDRYAGEHVVSQIDGIAVAWVDDAFRLVARDAGSRQTFVLPFLGSAEDRVGVVPRVPGPPFVRFSAPRLEIVGIEHDDDEGRLVVVRTRVDGTEAAPLELRLAPPHEVARARTQARAHASCVELARTIAGASYRDATLVAQATDDGARLGLEATRQSLEVRFVADREVLVSLTTAGAEGETLAVDESAFGRLARWVRSRLSRDHRNVAAAEAEWAARMARELAGSLEVIASEVRASTASGAVLEVALVGVPGPELLARWIARVRDDLAAARHRTREGT